MGVVLGIDPAWTEANPSGVAVLQEVDGRWRCRAVAPGYSSFLALARGEAVDWRAEPHGGAPDPGRILDAARTLCRGAEVNVVAVDMPVSRIPFEQRRPADDLAARALNKAGCGVHSPTPERPGKISAIMSGGLLARGYQVAGTGSISAGMRPLIEVYPHPAAMSLLGVTYRVPYKTSRTSKYWPGEPPAVRIARLLDLWTRLRDALGASIDGIGLPLPKGDGGLTLSGMKRYEDALDALICAWVGTKFLEGACAPLGDRDAAIWVPPLPGVDIGNRRSPGWR